MATLTPQKRKDISRNVVNDVMQRTSAAQPNVQPQTSVMERFDLP